MKNLSQCLWEIDLFLSFPFLRIFERQIYNSFFPFSCRGRQYTFTLSLFYIPHLTHQSTHIYIKPKYLVLIFYSYCIIPWMPQNIVSYSWKTDFLTPLFLSRAFFLGYFWHITDLHFDSLYSTKGDVSRSK